MKALYILLLSISLFAAPSGVYIEAYYDNPTAENLDLTNATYSYDKGLATSFAVGYQMDTIRFELEGNYSKNELLAITKSLTQAATGDFTKMGALANVYYDMYNDTNLISSVGVGIGATNIETKNLDTFNAIANEVSEDAALTYQGTLSLGYKFNEDIVATIRYRYLGMEALEEDTQTFSLGMRYLF